MIIHYVYYSYELYGRAYIGKHKLDLSTGLTPETDGYYGSFLDKTFKPTHKFILEVFDSEVEAYDKEREYQEALNVVNSPYFANRSIQKTSGFYFDRTGISHSTDTKVKISQSMKERRKSPANIEKYSKMFDGEKNPRYLGDRYTWTNKHLGVVEVELTVLELEAKYPELTRASLYNVKNNKVKSHKGWVITNANQKPENIGFRD